MAPGHRILVSHASRRSRPSTPCRAAPTTSSPDRRGVLRSAPGPETRSAARFDVFEAAGVTAVPGFGAWAYSSTGHAQRRRVSHARRGFLDAVRANREVDGIYALPPRLDGRRRTNPTPRATCSSRRGRSSATTADRRIARPPRRPDPADAPPGRRVRLLPDLSARGLRDDRGRAARLLLRILDEGVRPVTARVTIPALVRGDEIITETRVFGRFTQRAADVEAERGRAVGRDAHQQPVHRRPGAPHERLRHDRWRPRAGGRRGAGLATGFWEVHERMVQPLVSLDEAVEAAKTTDGTVILTDAADATSSGASGDSNAVLARSSRPATAAPSSRRSSTRRRSRRPSRPESAARSGRPSAASSDPGAVHPDAVRGRGRGDQRRPLPERIGRARVVQAGPTAVLRTETDDGRGHEPAGHAPRPLAVPRPRPGPAGVRCRRRQVAALRAATCSTTGRRGPSTSTRRARRARTCAASATRAARDRSSRSTTTCRSSPSSSCIRAPRYGVADRPGDARRWRRREDPRDPRGRAVRGDAGGRLEQGAPARGFGPHARRGRHRGGPGRLRQRRSPTSTSSARRSPSSSRSTAAPRAIEPERTSEILHQNTFWLGRGGSLTHAISGIDIALWDLFGQATGQPVGRLLGGRYLERVRPYASILMREPEPLAERARAPAGRGVPGVQARLGSVRPGERAPRTRRSCGARARRSVRTSR